jgi:transcriptional regulator with XRE-family HTH domain
MVSVPGAPVVGFPGAQGAPLQFGALLKARRRQARLSQKDLADMMHVTRNTVVNWEADKSRPDYAMLPTLCTLLNIRLHELFGIPAENGLSPLEDRVVRHLRALSPAGRRVADRLVSALAEEEQRALDARLKEDYALFFVRPGSLAAGTAGNGSCYVEDGPTPFFLRVSERTARADAVIRVSGHSMEPVYQDGDYVCFQRASSANPGEDVVVAWAGEQYVKRLTGGGELISINPDYPFRYDGAGDDIYITGRVLGIVASEDRPRQEDLPLLEELFSRELAGFSEKAD